MMNVIVDDKVHQYAIYIGRWYFSPLIEHDYWPFSPRYLARSGKARAGISGSAVLNKVPYASMKGTLN